MDSGTLIIILSLLFAYILGILVYFTVNFNKYENCNNLIYDSILWPADIWYICFCDANCCRRDENS